MGEVKLHPGWLDPLRQEFASPYMAALREFLVAEKAAGKRIFPAGSEGFRALDLTPLEQVRVVARVEGEVALIGGVGELDQAAVG